MSGYEKQRGRERDEDRKSVSRVKYTGVSEEPRNLEVKHASRDEIQASDSLRDSSPEKQSVQERLLTLSSNSPTGENERGKWLKEKIEEYCTLNKIDLSAEPTEEDIRLQLKLPTLEAINNGEFKDPLTNWLPTKKNCIPGWIKELLPEAEIVGLPDWSPPTPLKVDLSLIPYKKKFKTEEFEFSKVPEVVKDEDEILRQDLDVNDEFVLGFGGFIIRTTMKELGIKKPRKVEGDRKIRGGREASVSGSVVREGDGWRSSSRRGVHRDRKERDADVLKDRGFNKTRLSSFSPSRHVRRDESDYRRGRNERKGNDVYVDRRSKDRCRRVRGGSERSRSPAVRKSGDTRDLKECQNKRQPSITVKYPDIRIKESGRVREGERKNNEGTRYARLAERKDSYGGSREARPVERKEIHGDAEIQTKAEVNKDMQGHPGCRLDSRGEFGGRYQHIQPRQGHLSLPCESVGGARAQPLTYAEYKAMKAAEAADSAGR